MRSWLCHGYSANLYRNRATLAFVRSGRGHIPCHTLALDNACLERIRKCISKITTCYDVIAQSGQLLA